MKKNSISNRYMSLAKAANGTSYSQEYLSLRARSGKLLAKKIGRNWYTTREAVRKYVLRNKDDNEHSGISGEQRGKEFVHGPAGEDEKKVDARWDVVKKAVDEYIAEKSTNSISPNLVPDRARGNESHTNIRITNDETFLLHRHSEPFVRHSESFGMAQDKLHLGLNK